jgi:son of sevenless-like protein
LTDFEEADNNYLYSFMLTYKSFITTEDLLKYLITRYNTPPPSDQDFHTFKRNYLLPVRMRVAQILMYWVNEHFYNFRDNISLQTKLRHFITEEMSRTRMNRAADRLIQVINSKGRQRDTFTVQQLQKSKLQLDLIQKQISDVDARYKSTFGRLGLFNRLDENTSATATSSNTMESVEVDILQVMTPTQIAKCLTSLEYEMFDQIQPKECLNQSWNKNNQRTKAPNVYSMITRTNQMVAWVAQQVLKPETAKDRSLVITKLIKVSRELRLLNNFNSLKGIVAGLNSNAVHRLKKSWILVKQKHKDEFTTVCNLVGQQNNYKVMREVMDRASGSIPYIGMYLTDLTFIEDGNRDMKDELINFYKQRQLSCVIRNIQSHQNKKSQQFSNMNQQDSFMVHKLERTISTVQVDENELYELSLQREPRAS